LPAAAAACTGGDNWSQTFNYDSLGNVLKSGTQSFQPNYGINNRIATNINFAPNYDSDGNLLGDPVSAQQNVNAFDAEGHAVTLEGIEVTYDALGRAVEAAEPNGAIEFLYGPGGGKLAVMSGQTLGAAYIPLPGGGTAVYHGAALAYYRHADGLGSSRLASTPSRTLYSATAYAPYGEPHQESGTIDRNFTGQNQGITGGQYDFLMREFNPIQGRWWTPDPSGLAAVDPNNPQSWNRYAYVNGRPLSAIDPLGLETCTWDPSTNTLNCDLPQVAELTGGGGGSVPKGCTVRLDRPGHHARLLATNFDIDGSSRPRLKDVDWGDCGPGNNEAGGGAISQLPMHRNLAPLLSLNPQACSANTLVALNPNDPGARFTVADASVNPWFAPQMAADLGTAISRLNSEGVVPQLNSGFRFASTQGALYDGGAGPGAGLSLHEAGYAADFQQKGSIAWAMEGAGLAWGGNFSLPDFVHYYLNPFGVPGSPGYESALTAAANAAAQFALACMP